MKKVLVLLTVILLYNGSYGQMEDNIWHFGRDGAGLDFSNCDPVVITNGALGDQWEGVASMCNRTTGQLLFYTDGQGAFNSNNVYMPNAQVGLWQTITQNIIIPQPGNDSIYYIILPEPQSDCALRNSYHLGMTYAIINMNLDSGLGDVVSFFNPLIDSGNCEKITAIRNANGQDIWLIGHRYRNDSFFVFNVTPLGIDTVPTYYNIGPVIRSNENTSYGTSCFDAIGELKPSPNGKKIAFTTYLSGITALFDFNDSTGVISNPINLSISPYGGYGVSFSPDNSKLYFGCNDTTQLLGAPNGYLFQFDISSGNQTTIQNSRSLIYHIDSVSYGSLKLGPNGKIYATLDDGYNTRGSQYLEVINNPDSSGLACNYAHHGVSLNGFYSGWGLNNIMERGNYCNSTGISSPNQTPRQISLYPNPTSTTFTLSYHLQNSQLSILNSQFKLLDISGRIVYSKIITGTTGREIIDASALSDGMYFYQLTSASESWKGKVVIQR